jgi:hypothetical protein
MSDTDPRPGDNGDLERDIRAMLDDANRWFPLDPPDHPRDRDALDVLPEHLRGQGQQLIAEQSWLQRRIVADRARIDRIEAEHDRTPRRHHSRRAELLDRHEIEPSPVWWRR